MAHRKGNDKYLRLTGLWPSKRNEGLFTGKVKAEDIDSLIKKFEEALDADAPVVFSLWENNKKKSKRDPEFSLQCFVGDSEEKPRSRGREIDRHEEEEEAVEEEKPRRKSRRDEEEEPEEKEEEDEKPRRGRKTAEKSKSRKSSKSDW